MTIAESYQEGRAAGEREGEIDFANGRAVTHDQIEYAREEARTSTPGLRAFALGYMRGYRDVVRTFNYGKWGS